MTAALNLSLEDLQRLCLKNAVRVLKVLQEPDENTKMAQVAVEVDRCVCHAAGVDLPKPWSDMSEDEKGHVIAAVVAFKQDPLCTPESLHEEWVRGMTADGWSFGEMDDVKKTHPLLLPYSEMPMLQVLRDALFLSSVRLGGLMFSE